MLRETNVMTFRILRLHILLLSLFPLGFANVSRAAECPSEGIEKPVSSAIGSASMFSNVRNAEGSLNFESRNALTAAMKEIDRGTTPPSNCGDKCTAARRPSILFRTVPNAFLSEYDDRDLCTRFLEQTKAKPIRYSGKEFKSVDDFYDWFSSFSQGKGDEGEDLYQRCSGLCSPKYDVLLSPKADGAITAEVDVTCGHARDKDDNRYQINTSLRWTCSPKSA